MTSLTTVLAWNPEEVMASATSMRQAHQQLLGHRQGLDGAGPPPQWLGQAADQARSNHADQLAGVDRLADTVNRISQACLGAAEVIAACQQQVRDLQDQARTRGLMIDNAGSITPSPTMGVMGDSAADMTAIDELTSGLMAAVERAERADDDLRATLAAAVGSTADSPSASMPLTAPTGDSPQDNARWWNDLTEEQQQQVIEDHPDWIGNLDGIPAGARDEANRSLIDDYEQELRQQADEILRDAQVGGPTNEHREQLDIITEKLKGLEEVEQLLEKTDAAGDPRQLLLLDIDRPKQLLAAVAVGDVDQADHVGVLTPGYKTTVADSLSGNDNDISRLRQEAEAQIAADGRDETVATVAWLGYEAPQADSIFTPGESVAGPGAAEKGGEDLGKFLAGVNESRSQEPHLTALGYSYGSPTTGYALQEDVGVDDVVYSGSPGITTMHAGDLSVPDGHSYLLEAKNDAVADAGRFGGDPSFATGLTHLETGAAEVDGTQYDEVTGHTSYLSPDSTSLYNSAAVIADNRDGMVEGSNYGAGDFLRQLIPLNPQGW